MKLFIKIALEIILAVLLFFNVFVSKSIDTTFTLISLIVFLMLSIFIYGYRRPYKKNLKDTLLIITGLSAILIGVFYLAGFKAGFSTSYSSIFKRYILASTWIKVFLIVILSEILRYIILQNHEKKKTYDYIILGLMLVIMVFIDISTAKKIFSLTTFAQFYEFFALILVQSISKNLLLNYVSKRNGPIPGITYRFIVDLYMYFLPIVPRINIFIEAVILLVFPYIVYIVLNRLFGVIKLEPARKKKNNYVVSFISIVFFGLIVMLVSREFRYAMIAIGSESMTGVFNKGDAIIYEQINDYEENLKVGDIIVFNKNGVMIVHRIDDAFPLDGKMVYRTKGDANKLADNWIVTQDELIGVYKAKIMLIAWPSVLINELFEWSYLYG